VSVTLGLVITTIKALEESDRNAQLDRFCRPLHGLSRCSYSTPRSRTGLYAAARYTGLKRNYFFVGFNFQRTSSGTTNAYSKLLSKTTSRKSCPRDRARFSPFGDHAKLKIVVCVSGKISVIFTAPSIVWRIIPVSLTLPVTKSNEFSSTLQRTVCRRGCLSAQPGYCRRTFARRRSGFVCGDSSGQKSRDD
jgi:hypothetical protein